MSIEFFRCKAMSNSLLVEVMRPRWRSVFQMFLLSLIASLILKCVKDHRAASIWTSTWSWSLKKSSNNKRCPVHRYLLWVASHSLINFISSATHSIPYWYNLLWSKFIYRSLQMTGECGDFMLDVKLMLILLKTWKLSNLVLKISLF